MFNELNDLTFDKFKKLLYDEVGIVLSDEKRTMVANRLSKRLRSLSMADYEEYYEYVRSKQGHADGELQQVIDRLTTHKTYFFREQQHFDLLQKDILAQYKNRPLKIWSAACSSGEEVYSLCMLLTEVLGDHHSWSIFGSDISKTELELCERGEYSEDRVENLKKHQVLSHFTKNTDPSGKFTYSVSKNFSKHVDFGPYNLISDPPKKQEFDIIMIRNVLIYFEVERRRSILSKMLASLKPGGYLFTGRSETVINLISNAEVLQPSVFQKKT